MNPNQKSQSSERKGLVLLNLGTPDGPNEDDVRRYLKEFLMDPWVIDIPFVFRWLLVHLAILPRRPRASAELYKKIWTSRGSPLHFHLIDLVEKVQATLDSSESSGSSWMVQPAMRYGKPSIRSAFEALKSSGIENLVVLPLYPQYSLSATESSIQECLKILREIGWNIPIKQMSAFYNSPLFIDAFTQVINTHLKQDEFDHILFSFHGLPERQVKKTESVPNHCLSTSNCCDQINHANTNCYRAQCFQTARSIAAGLNLTQDRYTVCFQSRLGTTPWIKPYTDELYRELPKTGIRRLAVICPAFVADCLETLEEVQLRGKAEFVQNGGQELKLIPSLNSSDVWVSAVSQMVLSFLSESTVT